METITFEQEAGLLLTEEDRLEVQFQIEAVTNKREAAKMYDFCNHPWYEARIRALNDQLRSAYRPLEDREILAIRHCLGGHLGYVHLSEYSRQHGPYITKEAAEAVIRAQKILPPHLIYYVCYYDPTDGRGKQISDDPVIIGCTGPTSRSGAFSYFIAAFGEKVNTLPEMLALYHTAERNQERLRRMEERLKLF